MTDSKRILANLERYSRKEHANNVTAKHYREDVSELITEINRLRKQYECCPICDEGFITTTVEEHKFLYGEVNPVELSATVPVHTCNRCGESYLSGDTSEGPMADAVTRHKESLNERRG